MKGVAVKINRLHKKAYISRGKLLDCMGNMYHLIMPFIENDTDIQDRDIVIDYMAGDGFSFMIGENGVSPISQKLSCLFPLMIWSNVYLI